MSIIRNVDAEYPEDDDYELDEDDWEDDWDFDCGMGRDGLCGNAGSEECDFECPYRNDKLTLVHIAVSPVPLTAGVEQQALCGTRIPKAQWIWTAEHGGQDIKDIFTRLTCADCWRCEWDGHYVYGIVRGGEHR